MKPENSKTKAPTALSSSALLGVVTKLGWAEIREVSRRKTPAEWLDKISRNNDPKTNMALKNIADIQREAWIEGMADAANLCIQNAELGNPEGWTDSVSRECAKIIIENITKSVATTPNDKTEPRG